ncbi:MAG TPA: hypothetical protein VGG33_23295 [Polyangia bacterium]
MSFPRQVIPGRTYLVTRRCTQRQLLLRPDKETNNAFVYCLAYAAKKAEVDIVAFIANANHYHAVVIDRTGTIPKFLELFHKLLAKHQNALRRRWENMWSTEQTSLVELVGPEDVLAKIVYTLTNPVKDHLVEKAHHWPGATSLMATLHCSKLVARRPLRFFRRDGEMPEELSISMATAPGFEHFEAADYANTLREAICNAEAAAAQERRAASRGIMGRKNVLAQSPEERPQSQRPRRELDPRVAARDKLPRIEALQRLKAFRAAYAAARRSWLGGNGALFPCGTWWLRRCAAVPCADEVAAL